MLCIKSDLFSGFHNVLHEHRGGNSAYTAGNGGDCAYDGLNFVKYAVAGHTALALGGDLLGVKDILKVSEGRWEIEECFRIMKTDFEARPIYLQDEIRIKAHFLICFLALIIYRYLEKSLGNTYTCETILDKLKTMNFSDIQEQGFIPLYTRDKLTDALHDVCGFDTDFKFITKSQMKTIQKKAKEDKKYHTLKRRQNTSQPA